MTLWDLPPVGSTPVEREALRLWREREASWPAFVRRPNPDGLDLISGAWALAIDDAARSLAAQRTGDLQRHGGRM